MLIALVVLLISFSITFLLVPFVMRHAARKGFVGIDVNKISSEQKKEKREKVPELGGIAIAGGIVAAILFGVAANSFAMLEKIFDANLNVIYLLAALCVILMIELIGFVDDVLGIRHRWKFLLPFVVALPLMAVKISALHPFTIPFIFSISNPWIYELILIPIGVAAATNLTNTFAGFNGMESGMGLVIAFFLFAIGFIEGNYYVMILSASLAGALIAFLRYNWYPAKIFPDDVGTLLIGAAISTIVIIGGIEVAGVIMMLPYIADFLFFKIPNRLPSSGWWGTLKGRKLTHEGKPIHLCQWIMQKTGGISERNLVLLLIFVEVILGAIAFFVYYI